MTDSTNVPSAKRTLLHFAAATLLLGCASDSLSNESGGECSEGKCDGNGSLLATNNGNVTLGGGYLGTFDKTASQCVQPDPSTSAGRALVSVG
nr:hypothetical protein [Deltaproteobacteria bacterium]